MRKPGTYQPSTSATTCLKAEIGTYVEDDRSAEATVRHRVDHSEHRELPCLGLHDHLRDRGSEFR